MKKALVVFSGGQDSTTVLGWAKNRFETVETISFSYGQRHAIELKCAKKIATVLGIKNTVFDITALKQIGESTLLSDGDISSAHPKNSSLPSSFVPNRNALLFTLSHAYAQKIDADFIVSGVCETDYSGYPDCRESFVQAIENALNLGSGVNIKFLYPLMKLDKAETFRLASDEGVLEIVINESHTCYEGDRSTLFPWGYGCGKCPACNLRAKGWEKYIKTL